MNIQMHHILGNIGLNNNEETDEYGNNLQNFWAKSVCAIILEPKHISKNEEDEKYTIRGPLLKDTKRFKEYPLVDKDDWANQVSAAEGTGFLVAKNMVVTALHVVNGIGENDFKNNAKLVFDFRFNRQPNYLKFEKSQIYSVKKIITPEKGTDGKTPDFALIEIDPKPDSPYRDYFNLSSIDIRLKKPETKLYAIGHPLGLPQKFSQEGKLYTVTQKESAFTTNLDVFEGNSGSPVISINSTIDKTKPEKHEVEGIILKTNARDIDYGDTNARLGKSPDNGTAFVTCLPIQLIKEYI